jgi:uncharacterized protein (TIGR03067 family)
MCHVAVLLTVLAILLGARLWAGGGVGEDAVSKEIKLFHGSWKAVALQRSDGSKASDEQVQNTRLVVEGNKFTLTTANYKITGTFTVDPTKTPKTIDVTLGDGQGAKLLGIYEQRGDTRKSYFALPEKERPRQFGAESGYIGFEWKRN